WIGATALPASTRTRSCSSRSATPVRPSSRSRRPSRCADGARCANSASPGRSRLARTTACGAASARTSAARSSAATPGPGSAPP
ncbi:MAG: WhiB-like transcription regulator, partial [uncultured Nocardioides sp.]